MKNNESLNSDLFSLLRSRGYNPTMLGTDGKEMPVPEEAEVFQFTFVKDELEYGPVTISIDGLHKLVVYFGDNVANSPSEETHSEDTSWYTLLNLLKRFSQRHQLSFQIKNTDHLKYDMAKRTHMKKVDESKKLNELSLDTLGSYANKRLKTDVDDKSPKQIDKMIKGLHGARDRLMKDQKADVVQSGPKLKTIAKADLGSKPIKLAKGYGDVVQGGKPKPVGKQPKDVGVQEGSVSKAIKNIKRGLQGWGNNSIGPGGEETGNPKDIVKRAKGANDDTVRRLHKTATSPLGFPFRQGDYDGKDKHSPAGLQKRVLDREIKKRGLDKNKVAESYYATGKKSSYSDNVPNVKIILQHNRQLEEGEQRYRSIAKIFVENADGERFAIPTNKPGLARVYARHIAEGGTPYDESGKHITALCEEYTKMAGFVRATRSKQFNESTQSLINEGVNHYQKLRETLHKMAGHRGYHAYFESWTPTLTEDEDTTDLSEMFATNDLDPRIESVMPILRKLNKTVMEMSEVTELDEWADAIIEGEEQLDELSSDTLNSYYDKSLEKAVGMTDQRRVAKKAGDSGAVKGIDSKFKKMGKGIDRAFNKIRAKSHPEEPVTEVSNELLGRYKKKAGEYAKAADTVANNLSKSGQEEELAGRFRQQADKKFKGIVQATNKQFANDAKAKPVDEASAAAMGRAADNEFARQGVGQAALPKKASSSKFEIKHRRTGRVMSTHNSAPEAVAARAKLGKVDDYAINKSLHEDEGLVSNNPEGIPEAAAGPKKFPDTAQGAVAYLKSDSQPGFLRELGIGKPYTKIRQDPSVEGVWAIDNYRDGVRVIVYLGGYKDPWGKIREYGDFESGTIPKREMDAYAERNGISEATAKKPNFADKFKKKIDQTNQETAKTKEKVKQHAKDEKEVKTESFGDMVKGVKRTLAGKVAPKKVERQYADDANAAIKYGDDAKANKAVDRFVKVSKVVSPKAFPPGYKAPPRQSKEVKTESVDPLDAIKRLMK